MTFRPGSGRRILTVLTERGLMRKRRFSDERIVAILQEGVDEALAIGRGRAGQRGRRLGGRSGRLGRRRGGAAATPVIAGRAARAL